MNERIKELAKDHLVHERFTTYGESIQEDYYEMYPEELEKFAALIIAECAKIADDNYDKGFCPVGVFIKEHFGVEE